MAKLKLTDTQSVVLAAAGARDSGVVLPLPKSLRINRGSQTIILKGLLKRELIVAREAAPGEEFWEQAEDGTRTTLAITNAGLAALGIAPPSDDAVTDALNPPGKDKLACESLKRAEAHEGPRQKEAGSVEPPKDTKLGILIAALRRKKGATIADLMEATGWQAHSVRAAISGALKKKLRLDIVSETADGRGRVYRIGGQPA